MKKFVVISLAMLFFLCGCAKTAPIKADQAYVDSVYSAFTQLVDKSNEFQKLVEERQSRYDEATLDSCRNFSAELEKLKTQFSDSEKMHVASYVGNLEQEVSVLEKELERLKTQVSAYNAF